MDLPINVIVSGKGPQTLDKNSYVAAGGEGTVCRIGGTAYKIYHDPKKMIPLAKITELQALSHIDNVLGPRDILLDTKNNPIGFTMPYISDTEFLTRLFNKNYRNDNGITPEMVVELVKKMQLTLAEIHKCGIIVVDFNEMNSLTTMKYKDIYFIDVDSYQTKSFRATALMESVRDRTQPKNQFSEKTDWFSFAIVSFQMYMTYHPYMKGKHQKYLPKDWSDRMDNNVSIFHPDVVLADIWKDFSVIPQPHLDWYKAVFHQGVRTAPPLPDQALVVGPVQPTLITGNEKFVVTKILEQPDPILNLYYLNGIMYTITKSGIYSGTRIIKSMTSIPKGISLANVLGSEPVLAIKSENKITFESLNGDVIGEIAAKYAMSAHGCIYTIYNGRMMENRFIPATGIGNKIFHVPKPVSNVFDAATKMFSGLAVQDILGKCWVVIPFELGKCVNTPIKELDGLRIIDAKFEHHVLVAIAEKDGQYHRYSICFNQAFTGYTCRVKNNTLETVVNFTCLSNGICVNLIEDDTIEVFKTNDTVKVVQNSPITTSMRLSNDSTSILFVNQKGIYSLKLK
jgi:serine/threonine protein kinase